MIFAAATDEKTLFVFASAEKAIAYCEGLDVEGGGWLFWDEAGSALSPEFFTPNRRDGFTVGNGIYQLVLSPTNPPLSEVAKELNHLDANPYFASFSAILAHLASAGCAAQHGA
ncbi:hypothetical protein FKV24_003940 [Lysobacter maris]|uniref:Uncharacterized protein n=1 Tax=Marilutibacter maris TaxID=1605891 RepID=A0A508AXZ8_9GAMM|nr:hypothetical protein [Lysobacter maris]KAB8197005.1 hypothetical protein FKV24_003940 [Lysobacter maris]